MNEITTAPLSLLGGTANLAVLGGNLPPSFGTVNARINWTILGAPTGGGRVARRNGLVARSTRNRSAATAGCRGAHPLRRTRPQ